MRFLVSPPCRHKRLSGWKKCVKILIEQDGIVAIQRSDKATGEDQ